MIRKICWFAMTFVLASAILAGIKNAHAAEADSQQLAALMPSGQDLQGYTQTQPIGEIRDNEVFRNGSWTRQDDAAMPVPDEVELNVDLSQRYTTRNGEYVKPWQGHYNKQRRILFSADGLSKIDITVWQCDSPAAAEYALEDYHANSNAVYHSGTLSGLPDIGENCWACAEYLPSKSLIFRSGSIAALVSGQPSRIAIRQGVQQNFPDAAIEAVAYEILLKAAQQPDLTGVSAQAAQVAVNGHALPKGAMKVAGRVYVPVREFARAMGMTSRWDSKTGALTLSGAKGKTVALTAGSAQAKVGGAKAAALAVPVLKSGGQPVMMLEDLVRLTGGRITGHAGNGVQVKG